MTDDIVARLRMYANASIDGEWSSVFKADLNIAADEIERLRTVVEAWLKYSQRAERDIETLRAERDEARRMWCDAAPVGNSLSVDDMDRRARAEAKRRGWDCFKEATDGK